MPSLGLCHKCASPCMDSLEAIWSPLSLADLEKNKKKREAFYVQPHSRHCISIITLLSVHIRAREITFELAFLKDCQRSFTACPDHYGALQENNHDGEIKRKIRRC